MFCSSCCSFYVKPVWFFGTSRPHYTVECSSLLISFIRSVSVLPHQSSQFMHESKIAIFVACFLWGLLSVQHVITATLALMQNTFFPEGPWSVFQTELILLHCVNQLKCKMMLWKWERILHKQLHDAGQQQYSWSFENVSCISDPLFIWPACPAASLTHTH